MSYYSAGAARTQSAQHLGHQIGAALGNLFFGGGNAAREAGRQDRERAERAQLLEDLAIEKSRREIDKLNETIAGLGISNRNAASAADLAQFLRGEVQNQYNAGNLDRFNWANTGLKEGATYEPFKAIGTTGHGFNAATGLGGILAQGLAELTSRESAADVAKTKAQEAAARAAAANSYAGARAHDAQAKLTNKKIEGQRLQNIGIFNDISGTGGTGSSAGGTFKVSNAILPRKEVDDGLGGSKTVLDYDRIQAEFIEMQKQGLPINDATYLKFISGLRNAAAQQPAAIAPATSGGLRGIVGGEAAAPFTFQN